MTFTLTKRAPANAVFAVALLTAATASPAADPPRTPAATLDDIVVTGTRVLDRTSLTSPVPVDVLTAEDLVRAGALGGELGQALQTVAPAFNFPRQSNSSGADHVRAAQLRGLSPDQTLVLVNGKRRHTSAVVNTDSKIGRGTTPVDFNTIPINAIKRIEVLRDGAGAQYGSDAIAGVINIILDDRPSGIESSLSYGVNHTRFEPIGQTLNDGHTWVADAKAGLPFGDGGFLSFGTQYQHRQATNRSGFDSLAFANTTPPTPNLALLNERLYRPGDPDASDLGFWYNARRPLEGGPALYSFATYADRQSLGAAFFRYPDSSDNILSIYPTGYRPETTGHNHDLSLVFGARSDAGALSWDGSLSYGRNAFDYGVRHSLNPSLDVASPTSFHLADFIFDQLTANADLVRHVPLSAFAQPLNLAVGAEFRHERFQTRAGDPTSYAAGPRSDLFLGAEAGPGLQPQDEANATRSVASAYADLSASVTEPWFVDLAARYEHYDDFGSAVAGKLSTLYALTPRLALRAAVSNSFRAPSLSQLGYRFTTTGFGNGGALVQVLTLPVSSPVAIALGARPLEAEKSVNLSAGITLTPADGTSLTLDAFTIKIKHRITLSSNLGGSNSSAIAQFVQTNFNLAGVQAVNYFTNAADTRTRGVDLVGSLSAPAAGGTLRLSLGYTYAKTSIDGLAATPQQLINLQSPDPLVGLEEQNTLTDAAPRTKALLTATWSSRDWTVLGRLIRYGSAVRQFDFGGGFAPRQEYGAKSQLDAEVEYRLTPRLGVALGGSNLLDRYPDLSSSDINYAGNLPYDVLSPIGMNGAYFYARLSAKF